MSQEDDPYQDFRYRVQWQGRYVAGFSDVSPFPQKLKIFDQHASGYPPPAIGPEGQGTCLFINLERGTTFDLGFPQWITMVRCYGPATGKGSLLRDYKTNFSIEERDEHGGILVTYRLGNCWVSEYDAIRGPDPGTREVIIEHMRLGFDRWERDPAEGD